MALLNLGDEALEKGYVVVDASLRSPENPQAQAHRERLEWLDALGQLGKSTLFFIFALVGVGAVLWYCVKTLLDPNTAPEEKKWALAAVTTILSGLIGFLTGKALK